MITSSELSTSSGVHGRMTLNKDKNKKGFKTYYEFQLYHDRRIQGMRSLKGTRCSDLSIIPTF